jgi:predicted HicB family RNase H-like nuclease
MGRPKLPTGAAKGQIVPVRFAPDVLGRITRAAAAKGQTVSEWIRGTVNAGLEA